MRRLSLILSFVLISATIQAFELNPLFTDHMVIQRDRPVRVFGKGEPGNEVDVSFKEHHTSISIKEDGSWLVTLPAMPVSSESSKLVVVCGNQTIEIDDVVIGDVWICSGQSNMGWGLWQSLPVPDDYPKASQIRLLRGKTPEGSETPQSEFVIDPDFNQSWQYASQEYAQKFSGVGYFFGLYTAQELDVPIGLIQATLGGTKLESWTPSETLRKHPDYNTIMETYEGEFNWAKENAKSPHVLKEYAAKRPAGLYNGMIHPLTDFSIKGVVWYQGEANAITAQRYRTLFPAAIESWRKAWGQGDLPFLFVQLPGYYGKNEWARKRTPSWPYQREAQEQALELPNTAMAVTLDQGHYTDIHPKVKNVVGKRLALHAISLDKKDIVADGPIFKNLKIKGDKAFVSFASVAKGLETRKVVIARTAQSPADDENPFIISSETLSGFEVSGSDGVFYPAKASIVGKNRVKLQSDDVDSIVHVRYAFAPFPLCNLYNSEGLPARPFRTDSLPYEGSIKTVSVTDKKKSDFSFPKVNSDHRHINLLLENAMAYINPEHQLTDPESGYPLEGWNQDPEKGLYLRSFTQLTAIGEWLELMANIVAGYADNPYVSSDQALKQANQITNSLLEDQNDPLIGAKGLLVNFLGLEDGKRLGPMARDVEKQVMLKKFGTEKGEKIWNALVEKEWLDSQKGGALGVIQRGEKYGSDYFDGPLEPFSDETMKSEIMELLDQRVVQVIFGDNANLSASVAKSIGALLRPNIKDDPKVKKLRSKLERFTEAQKEGYASLYDKSTDTFIFGWNATDDRYYGWDGGNGQWVIGHSNYYVSEFRAPELFVVLRHGLPINAVRNSGFKMKSYPMSDGTRRYTLAPWSGSAFQGLGLSLFMQELKNPAWRQIIENFVAIELDFAQRHNLPGFLSESYTGHGTEYTGEVGIPDIAVATEGRIIDAPSLYTLGVAYSVAPDDMEAFLKKNWSIIEQLFTDHGPWEGYNTTQKQPIRFQTAAHTLSFILGALSSGQENMARYLEKQDLAEKLVELYRPGQPVDILSGDTQVAGWTSDGSSVEATLEQGQFILKAPKGIRQGGTIFTLNRKSSYSNGQLRIIYRSQNDVQAALKFVRAKDETIVPQAISNEVYIHFDKTGHQTKEVLIPLPATPGLDGIDSLELNIVSGSEVLPIDLTFNDFQFKPYDTAMADPCEKGRPNFVIIYADDMGWGDVGFHGVEEIHTPHIDSLAATGVSFSQGYVSASVCSPSRAGLLTGVYQQRFGSGENPPEDYPESERSRLAGLPHSQPTLPEMLKPAGYYSGMVGKWHLGLHNSKRPIARGFDEYYGFLNGAHSYYESRMKWTGQNSVSPIYRNNKPVKYEGYMTDVFTDEAVDFIKRNKKKPFLLYLSYNAVHGPWQVPDSYIERLKDVSGEKRRIFSAMVLAMDDGVGRVVETLEEEGLDENTVVIFISDNGTPGGTGKEGYALAPKDYMSSTGSLRGFKGDTYEGGIRVPYIIKWPGQLPAGEKYDLPVSNLDIAPTITSFLKIPGPQKGFDYDGVDLLPYLTGKNTSRPHDIMYWRRDSDYAIRKGDWKLAWNDGRPTGFQRAELFNLAEDMGEKNDLSKKHPEIAQELQDIFDAWDSKLPDSQWWGGPSNRKRPQPEKKTKQHADEAPNIVLIMADDLGYECIGTNGCVEYDTPHLDRLAAQGIGFKNCYSTPLCTPSRVQIMTGRYNHRNYKGFGILDPGEITFGNMLRDAGYATCVAGKWQLRGDQNTPDHFGFDEHCLWFLYDHRKVRQGRRYWEPYHFIENGTEKKVAKEAYGPDLVSDYIVDFIGRNKSRPFFVYYPMMLTHAPFDPTPDSPKDASRAWDGEHRYDDDKYMKDMVEYMDKIVGKIVDSLDKNGVLENTVILFTGDNGTDKAVETETVNGPFKGGKGLMTDAGTHVPLIVDWPRHRADYKRIGHACDDLVDFSDFLPTFAALSGASLPEEGPIDGVSFAPRLLGQKPEPRKWIFCHYWGNGRNPKEAREFIRGQRWKLYNNGDFFDLKNDKFEQHPLTHAQLNAKSKTAKDRLTNAYQTFRKIPIPNNYSPVSITDK